MTKIVLTGKVVKFASLFLILCMVSNLESSSSLVKMTIEHWKRHGSETHIWKSTGNSKFLVENTC